MERGRSRAAKEAAKAEAANAPPKSKSSVHPRFSHRASVWTEEGRVDGLLKGGGGDDALIGSNVNLHPDVLDCPKPGDVRWYS